jgi:hypothetical protein
MFALIRRVLIGWLLMRLVRRFAASRGATRRT